MRTGVKLVSQVPLPSWPKKLSPQQKVSPEVVTPQVWELPALTDVNVWPSETGTGTLLELNVPLPSWPRKFLPQQKASPVLVMPQV